MIYHDSSLLLFCFGMSQLTTEDIFSIEDVDDVGDGEPLYSNFAPEVLRIDRLDRLDRCRIGCCCNCGLSSTCFKNPSRRCGSDSVAMCIKDVDDPDRLDIPEAHIAFYYSKYFKKALNPQAREHGFSIYQCFFFRVCRCSISRASMSYLISSRRGWSQGGEGCSGHRDHQRRAPNIDLKHGGCGFSGDFCEVY